MREFAGPVEQVERRDVVRTADKIFSALAGPKQNATVVAHRRLGDLHVEVIAVEGDFTGNGNAGLVGAEVVGTGLKTQRCRNTAELGFRTAVEEALGLSVVGDGLSKIEGIGLDMWEAPRAGEPSNSPRRAPCSASLPAILSLSCRGLDGAPPRTRTSRVALAAASRDRRGRRAARRSTRDRVHAVHRAHAADGAGPPVTARTWR